ncbi:MAG TPA: hypothetical protein VF261_00390 [Candidatus Saccharimonadales bacterium]
MTHEFTGSQPQEPLRTQIEAYIEQRRAWIGDAVELLGGDGSAPWESVLTLPTQASGEARENTPELQLDSEHEARLREIAGRFGIGGEQDVTLEQQGLRPGHVDIKEGGLVWKIAAEAELGSSNAGTIVYAGSPYRRTTDEERAFQQDVMHVTPDDIAADQTEYDVAKLVATRQPGFEALEQPEVLPFGYAVSEGNPFVAEPTGQLEKIGTQNGKDVWRLRIDRQVEADGSYRFQPDTATVMRLMAEYLTAHGDTDTAVGMTTSNTYASRAVDVVRAGLAQDRPFAVAMYGRQTLASAKHKPVTAPTDAKQLPGELAVMAYKLDQLAEAVRNQPQQA